MSKEEKIEKGKQQKRRTKKKELRMTNGKKKTDLEERLIDFAVRVIQLVDELPKSRIGNHIGSQLIRSGTSPAPNYGEAQDAESRSDFIHKIKIVLKELRETKVWLLMIKKARFVGPGSKLQPLIVECDELIAIFVKSAKTARENKKKRRTNDEQSSDE